MNIVIIEDEKLTAERLQNIIEKLEPDFSVIKVMDAVETSVKWFNEKPHYDLVFMDIQLSDGISFEIFEKASITAPIIFTTAYDEYAVKAFKVNSIDYILKPYDTDDIAKAIQKFKNNRPANANFNIDPALLEKLLKSVGGNYKNRFVIKVGEHIRFINTDEIAYFQSIEKSTFLQSYAGKNYALDYTLDELEEMVDPALFFRINRKYIVSVKSIADIVAYTNSRLKLKLVQSNDDEVIVSREKVQDFKKWLEG